MSIQDTFISALSSITNLGSDRYVKEFKRRPLILDFETNEFNDEDENAKKLLEKLKNSFENTLSNYPVLKNLDEIIFIRIIDLNNLKFTIIISDGTANITTGWLKDKRPTLLVPLFLKNLNNLNEILSDKVVDNKELYRIARVLFVSFIEGLYDADYLYTPGDKRYLKLDNLMHVELTEMEGAQVEGFPGSAKATVANVNGEWLVFEGHKGTPKVKITCNLNQALEYYQILMVEMKKSKDVGELKKVFEKYMKLREETCEDLTK